MPCESGRFIPERHKLSRIFTENCSKLWSSTKQYDPNDISKTNNYRTLVPAVPTSSPFGRSFRKALNAILSRLAEGDFLSRSLTAALTLAVVTSENVAKEVLEVSSCTLRIPGILVNCGRASRQDPLFLHWVLFPAVFATYGSFFTPPSQILRSCPDEWRAFSPWPNLCPCPPPTTRGSALFWNPYSSPRCCLPPADRVYPPSIYPSPNLKADVIPPPFPQIIDKRRDYHQPDLASLPPSLGQRDMMANPSPIHKLYSIFWEHCCLYPGIFSKWRSFKIRNV